MEENTWSGLRTKLEETQQFPLLYMFKFVLPSDNHKIAQVSGLFGDDAQITMRQSGKGNFTSMTVRLVMLNPDEIIHKYEQATTIKGVIAL